MRIRKSITVPIVCILVVMASTILVAGYLINRHVFYNVFEARERAKLRNIHRTIESLISNEATRISGLAKVLKNDTDLSYALYHYRAAGRDKKPLISAMHQLYSQVNLQIFLMADARGSVLHAEGGKIPDAMLKGLPPFQRAVRGEQPLTMIGTSEGWSLLAMVPVSRYGGKIPGGVLILGRRIDDDFARKIAAETGSEVFIASLDHVIARSYQEQGPGAIDLSLVRKSLHDEQPVFHTDQGLYRSYTYVPTKIAGHRICLVVETDISVIQDLLHENVSKTIQLGLVILVAISLVGAAFAVTLVGPLKELEAQACEVIREYSGEELSEPSRGNEIGTLVVAIRTMVETIKNHLSERTRAEEALRETSRTLQALIEASPLAIVVTDEEGTVRVWNPAAERIFGWPEDAALHRPNPILAERGNAELREVWSRTLKGEAFAGRELRCANRDGSGIVLAFFGAPLADNQWRIVGLTAIMADVTEARRAEEELRRSEEKLRQAQKMEAVGRLAGGVAHDFNNMLSVIMGYCEMLLSRAGPDGAGRAEVQEIFKAGERAASLTQQLLAFSRRQVLVPRTVQINEVVANLSEMLCRLIGEDVELALQTDPDLWTVEADTTQIEQILMNLAVNARDAMPRGGTLRIATANLDLERAFLEGELAVPAGQYAGIEISDNGCGMDEQTVSRIFEPFFTTKEQGKGTGLGLATVYGIVKQSGGFIRVRSAPGSGTTFTIYLPRGRREEQAAQERPSRKETTELRGNETLLLVEDEEMVRELACHALRRYGYNVLEAANGHEAMSISERYAGRIDLMISDAVMPGMNGLELAERLAAARPGMPVVIISGYSQEAIDHLGAADTAFSFLQKPITPSRLCETVREILRAPDSVVSG
jgi:PAS domain S-box-containing protein